jgi:hypothetical protein
MPQYIVRGPTQTDQIGPIQTLKWVGDVLKAKHDGRHDNSEIAELVVLFPSPFFLKILYHGEMGLFRSILAPSFLGEQ